MRESKRNTITVRVKSKEYIKNTLGYKQETEEDAVYFEMAGKLVEIDLDLSNPEIGQFVSVEHPTVMIFSCFLEADLREILNDSTTTQAEMTYQAIAHELKINRQKVSRIYNSAMQKLRDNNAGFEELIHELSISKSSTRRF